METEEQEIKFPLGLGADLYKELAHKRRLFLLGEIDNLVATNLVAHFLWLDSLDSNLPIELYINSSGGVIEGGLLTIIDMMAKIKAPISTICIGEAYSSAGFILSAGTKGKRFATTHSKIMLHGVQVSDLAGTQKEIAQEQKQIKNLNDALIKLICNNTGQSMAKIKKDLKNDKYFTAEEAIKYGIIDEIL